MVVVRPEEVDKLCLEICKKILDDFESNKHNERHSLSRNLIVELDELFSAFLVVVTPVYSYFAKVVHVADILLQEKTYDVAGRLCYARVLREMEKLRTAKLNAAYEAEQDVTNFGHSGVQTREEVEAEFASDEVASLRIHVTMCKAVCDLNVSVESDPLLQRSRTVQDCVEQLRVIQTCIAESAQRSAYLLIDNGCTHMRSCCDLLINNGHSDKAIPFLAYSVLSMESMLVLNEPKFLPLRTALHGDLARAYELINRPDDAKTTSLRALEKVHDLFRLEFSDRVPPSKETQDILNGTRQSAVSMLLRHAPPNDPIPPQPQIMPASTHTQPPEEPTKGGSKPSTSTGQKTKPTAAPAVPSAVAVQPYPRAPFSMSTYPSFKEDQVNLIRDKYSVALLSNYTSNINRVQAVVELAGLDLTSVSLGAFTSMPAEKQVKLTALLLACLDSIFVPLKSIEHHYTPPPPKPVEPEEPERPLTGTKPPAKAKDKDSKAATAAPPQPQGPIVPDTVTQDQLIDILSKDLPSLSVLTDFSDLLFSAGQTLQHSFVNHVVGLLVERGVPASVQEDQDVLDMVSFKRSLTQHVTELENSAVEPDSRVKVISSLCSLIAKHCLPSAVHILKSHETRVLSAIQVLHASLSSTLPSVIHTKALLCVFNIYDLYRFDNKDLWTCVRTGRPLAESLLDRAVNNAAATTEDVSHYDHAIDVLRRLIRMIDRQRSFMVDFDTSFVSSVACNANQMSESQGQISEVNAQEKSQELFCVHTELTILLTRAELLRGQHKEQAEAEMEYLRKQNAILDKVHKQHIYGAVAGGQQEKFEKQAASVERPVPEFSPKVESRLLAECGQNFYQKALLCSEMARLHTSQKTQQIKLFNDAVTYVEACEEQEIELLEHNLSSSGVGPSLHLRGPNSIELAFRGHPGQLYMLYGKESKIGKIVTSSDTLLTGTGERILANAEGLVKFKVKNLKPNANYVFSVQHLDASGVPSGPMSIPTPEICTLHPLPTLLAWASVALSAFDCGCLDAFQKACDVVYSHFVDKREQEEFHHFSDLLRLDTLNESSVLNAPLRLLEAFVRVIHVMTDARSVFDNPLDSQSRDEEQKLDSDSKISFVPSQRELLCHANKLSIALEVSLFLDNFVLVASTSNRMLTALEPLTSLKHKPAYIVDPLISVVDALCQKLQDSKDIAAAQAVSTLVDPTAFRTIAVCACLKSIQACVRISQQEQNLAIAQHASTKFGQLLSTHVCIDSARENKLIADLIRGIAISLFSSPDCYRALLKSLPAGSSPPQTASQPPQPKTAAAATTPAVQPPTSPASALLESLFLDLALIPAIHSDAEKAFGDVHSKYKEREGQYAAACAFVIESMFMQDKSPEAIQSAAKTYLETLNARSNVPKPTLQPMRGQLPTDGSAPSESLQIQAAKNIQFFRRYLLANRRARAQRLSDLKYRSFVENVLAHVEYDSAHDVYLDPLRADGQSQQAAAAATAAPTKTQAKPDKKSSTPATAPPSAPSSDQPSSTSTSTPQEQELKGETAKIPSHLSTFAAWEVLGQVHKKCEVLAYPDLMEVRQRRQEEERQKRQKEFEEQQAAAAAAAAAQEAADPKPKKGDKPKPAEKAKSARDAPAADPSASLLAPPPPQPDPTPSDIARASIYKLLTNLARTCELARRSGSMHQLHNAVMVAWDVVSLFFVKPYASPFTSPTFANKATEKSPQAHLESLKNVLIEISQKALKPLLVIASCANHLVARVKQTTSERKAGKKEEYSKQMRVYMRVTEGLSGAIVSMSGLRVTQKLQTKTLTHPSGDISVFPSDSFEKAPTELISVELENLWYDTLDLKSISQLVLFTLHALSAEGRIQKMYEVGTQFCSTIGPNRSEGDSLYRFMYSVQKRLRSSPSASALKAQAEIDPMRQSGGSMKKVLRFMSSPMQRAESPATGTTSFFTSTPVPGEIGDGRPLPPEALVRSEYERISKEKAKVVKAIEHARRAYVSACLYVQTCVFFGGDVDSSQLIVPVSEKDDKSPKKDSRSDTLVKLSIRPQAHNFAMTEMLASDAARHYYSASELLRQKHEVLLASESFQEFGDLYLSHNDLTRAFESYMSGIDMIFSRVDAAYEWQSIVTQMKTKGGIRHCIGLWQSLMACVLLSKAARICPSQHRTTELCLFASEVASSLFSQSVSLPQTKSEHDTTSPTDLAPESGLFSDPHRCDLPTLVQSLKFSALSLINSNRSLYALPLLSLCEHVAVTTARAPALIAETRALKSRALVHIGHHQAASQIIFDLMIGRGLPKAVSPFSSLQDNFHNWLPESTVVEAPPASSGGESLLNSSLVPRFEESEELASPDNSKWVDIMCERKVAPALTVTYGDALVHLIALAKSELLVAIAASQPVACLTPLGSEKAVPPGTSSGAANPPKPTAGGAQKTQPAATTATTDAKSSGLCAKLLNAAESTLRSIQTSIVSSQTSDCCQPAVLSVLLLSCHILAEIELIRGRTESSLQILSGTLQAFSSLAPKVKREPSKDSLCLLESVDPLLPLRCRLSEIKCSFARGHYAQCLEACSVLQKEAEAISDVQFQIEASIYAVHCDFAQGNVEGALQRFERVLNMVPRLQLTASTHSALLQPITTCLTLLAPHMSSRSSSLPIGAAPSRPLSLSSSTTTAMSKSPKNSKIPTSKFIFNFLLEKLGELTNGMREVVKTKPPRPLVVTGGALERDAVDLATETDSYDSLVASLLHRVSSLLESRSKELGFQHERQEQSLLSQKNSYIPTLPSFLWSLYDLAVALRNHNGGSDSLQLLHTVITFADQTHTNMNTLLSRCNFEVAKLLRRELEGPKWGQSFDIKDVVWACVHENNEGYVEAVTQAIQQSFPGVHTEVRAHTRPRQGISVRFWGEKAAEAAGQFRSMALKPPYNLSCDIKDDKAQFRVYVHENDKESVEAVAQTVQPSFGGVTMEVEVHIRPRGGISVRFLGEKAGEAAARFCMIAQERPYKLRCHIKNDKVRAYVHESNEEMEEALTDDVRAVLSPLTKCIELLTTKDDTTVHDLELLRLAYLESAFLCGVPNEEKQRAGDPLKAISFLLAASNVAQVQKKLCKDVFTMVKRTGVALKSTEELPSFVLQDKRLCPFPTRSITDKASVAIKERLSGPGEDVGGLLGKSAKPTGSNPTAPATPSVDITTTQQQPSFPSSLFQFSYQTPPSDATTFANPLSVLLAFTNLAKESCGQYGGAWAKREMVEPRCIALHNYLRANLPLYDELIAVKPPPQVDAALFQQPGFFCCQWHALSDSDNSPRTLFFAFSQPHDPLAPPPATTTASAAPTDKKADKTAAAAVAPVSTEPPPPQIVVLGCVYMNPMAVAGLREVLKELKGSLWKLQAKSSSPAPAAPQGKSTKQPEVAAAPAATDPSILEEKSRVETLRETFLTNFQKHVLISRGILSKTQCEDPGFDPASLPINHIRYEAARMAKESAEIAAQIAAQQEKEKEAAKNKKSSERPPSSGSTGSSLPSKPPHVPQPFTADFLGLQQVEILEELFDTTRGACCASEDLCTMLQSVLHGEH